MSERTTPPAIVDPGEVRRGVTVPLALAEAFEVFVGRFDDIKPKEHNLLGSPIVQTSMDRHVGGTIHDVAEDGSRCEWARVLAFDPPRRLVFSWNISPTWQLETDPGRASEVEVTFTPEGDESTHVELVHRHLERHGANWESMRAGVDDEAGWTLYLARYAALTGATA